MAFVPLGFLLAWQKGARGALVAVAIGAGFSLAIETAQIWIPGRSSSAIDLACNTAGALIGALLALRLHAGATAENETR